MTNRFDGGTVTYQCKRMSSLFKDVYSDGTVKYVDVDRCLCFDINSLDLTYTSGLASRIIDEMFPITMPYYPSSEPIKVYCEDFLTDIKNGSFDTIGIFYAIKSTDEKVEITRFFKYDNNSWEEINIDEYNERKSMRI